MRSENVVDINFILGPYLERNGRSERCVEIVREVLTLSEHWPMMIWGMFDIHILNKGMLEDIRNMSYVHDESQRGTNRRGSDAEEM